MAVTDTAVYFIHSPSIPMTLKDTNVTLLLGKSPPELPTLDPGHEAILEMHANSETSALFYVVVVLVLYVLALIAVLTKYLRTERYDNRLTRLYDEFISRDRYVNRVAKRDATAPQSAPKATKVEEQKQNLVIKMVNPEFVV
ncbi:uncharacterized protein TNCV_2486971 [Trichonephila clavipes]|uniref:Uncharacterized protein n=1 Tax=Trichonephila clavipes TaxID=2585209 RepID=A0A8X7BCK6_TRICX|nr:uncharacterized protein TNCV_2486971 [Trichonephila clavipes]